MLTLHVASCSPDRSRLPASRDAAGNRRAPVFFEQGDYALYRDLLAEQCRKASVACWSYCLMPNHVHLILVPATADGPARAIGETHRQYTGFVNTRARWTGTCSRGALPPWCWTRNTAGGALRGTQSGAGAAGATAAGPVMVETARASWRPR